MRSLTEYLKKNDIYYNDETLRMFEDYRSGILEKNRFINLTAITDPEEFTLKHFVDSATCCVIQEYMDADKILDMGTGAGFPGVPLAILSPEKEFVLVDSLKKRLKIIDELCCRIGIKNVTTLHARAEDLARRDEHREKYDLCLSRAVANLSTLSEYCLPFVRQGGSMIAYKGAEAETEVKNAENAVKQLGGKFRRTVPSAFSGEAEEHKLVIIEKTGKTPSKYPRKAGTPAKEPLK